MQTNVAEPKCETKNADKKPIIVSIEGNIGSGKTTIIDNLEKYYNLQLENDDKESIIF